MLGLTVSTHPLATRFHTFIEARRFACVGAKSAHARQRMGIIVAGGLSDGDDDRLIHSALLDFARACRRDGQPFESLVVIFDDRVDRSELAFEAAMWARLQALSDLDAASAQPYDPRVSPDPCAPDFSLSFGAEAFFVVGLHSRASRPARRFEAPAIAFNPHHQFQTLREQGRYEPLRERIIARDIVLAGSANPMLARHGERSSARQYSGRAVPDTWVCPFQAHHKKDVA